MGPSIVLLVFDQTTKHQFMQIAGTDFQLLTKEFLSIVEQRPLMRNLMLRFIHVPERSAGASYGVPEAEIRRLIGEL